ncbi:hypothetical protein AAZX31_07G232400 [Glycine max]
MTCKNVLCAKPNIHLQPGGKRVKWFRCYAFLI